MSFHDRSDTIIELLEDLTKKGDRVPEVAHGAAADDIQSAGGSSTSPTPL